MKSVRGSTGVKAVLAMAAVTAQAAGAVDLTGTWEGEQICDLYVGDNVKLVYKHDTMRISQQGEIAQMGSFCSATGCYFLYHGLVVDDAKDPERKGQAAFNVCPSPDAYYELLRIDKLELKGGRDAPLDGDSHFFQIVNPAWTGVGNCTWKYKRVSKADQGVVSCTASIAAPTHDAGAAPRVRTPQ
jgi:hypothetical protein